MISISVTFVLLSSDAYAINEHCHTVEKKRKSCFAEKWILERKALLLDFEKHRGLFL